MTATAKADLTIVAIMADLATHYKKAYIFTSQDKLVELHARRTRRRMSRRSMNRHLKGLEQQGFFKRIRRHRHDRKHGFTFRSTLYVLTGRAFKFFAQVARTARASTWGSRVTIAAHHLTSSKNIIGQPPTPGGLANNNKDGGQKQPATLTPTTTDSVERAGYEAFRATAKALGILKG